MSRSRALAIAAIVTLLVVAHLALYQHVANRVTTTARDPATGEDRARDVRLLLQFPVLADLALVCGLIIWAAARARELRELRELRGRYAAARKTLEKERSLPGVERRLRAMLEHAPLAMLLLDDEGRLLYGNRRALELAGLDRQRLAEVRFADLLAPQAVVDFADLRHAVELQGAQTLGLTMRSTGGVGAPVRAHFSALPREEEAEASLLAAFLEPAARLAPGAAPSLDSTARNVVLVADDEEIIRVLMRNMLLTMGFQPLLAADGQEALELFAQHRGRIAAVVLDVVMPRLGGEEAAAAIQAIAPDTPILLCSGLAQLPAEAPRDLRDRLLRKPFRYEDFQLALQTVISAAPDATKPLPTT